MLNYFCKLINIEKNLKNNVNVVNSFSLQIADYVNE